METGTAARLAWASFALSAVAIVVAAVISVVDGGSIVASMGFAAVSIAAFPLMGALIASRRPENAIGWIFCAIGVSWGFAALSAEYSTYAFGFDHPPVGGGVAAWMQRWIWVPGVTLTMTFLLLLYPDGHLPSRRWRPVAWLAGFALVLQVVARKVPLPVTVDGDGVGRYPQEIEAAVYFSCLEACRTSPSTRRRPRHPCGFGTKRVSRSRSATMGVDSTRRSRRWGRGSRGSSTVSPPSAARSR